MQKTDGETKKGLEVCNIWMVDEPNRCMECPYFRTKDCADTLMKHALAYIRQLEAQVPRWIPVEERLPKHDGWVLVIVNGEHGITTFYDAYMLARYYPADGWLIDDYENWETPDVSFWLPLPEPPKEEPPC